MIGTMLGQYRIEAELGAGGMGVVYRGRDTRLDRPVAIKLLADEQSRDLVSRSRFLTEARAVAALDHPNICSIYQVDETPDGRAYLVMAMYEGEPLDEVVARGALPVRRALELALQMANGLAQAHARGIVHRDLKPGNLFLTREGTLKILDFGLAKTGDGDGLTHTGVSVGTPAYMAPEQVRGEPVGKGADVWAAGVVLFELLTGRRPFAGDNMASLLYTIAHEPHPVLTLGSGPLADPLRALLDRCLDKDPANRPRDAAELATELERLARQAAATEESATMEVVVRPGVRSQATLRSLTAAPARPRVPGWVRAVALGAALLAAAAAGVYAWRATHAPAAVRVAVLAPRLVAVAAADSGEAMLAAANVLSSSLRELAGLRALAPLDGSALKGVADEPVAIAGALAADEALAATVTGATDEWRVGLQRLDAKTGAVRWAADFSVPRNRPLMLADALGAQLQRGFAAHPPRGKAERAAVDSVSYAEFVTLDRAYRVQFAAAIPPEDFLARIARVQSRAPRFLDAFLLEAYYAAHQYEVTRDGAVVAHAREAAERARQLAPDDPRTLTARLEVAMLERDLPTARTLLAELRRLDPGSADVAFRAARLRQLDGDVTGAIADLQELVRRRPARSYYERLVRMEYDSGRYDDARAHLELLAERYPDYLFPRGYLAQLELLYGRPARAESLYAQLAERFPASLAYRSNLALARMLVGDFAGSRTALAGALELAPDNAALLLNTADAEALLGHEAAAKALYARALAAIEADPAADSPGNLADRAQCQAHLGRAQQAVDLAQRAQRGDADNPDVQFKAALVYTLLGERTSALVAAKRSLEKGMQPRWFELPWFAPLRSDAEFAKALQGPPAVAAK